MDLQVIGLGALGTALGVGAYYMIDPISVQAVGYAIYISTQFPGTLPQMVPAIAMSLGPGLVGGIGGAYLANMRWGGDWMWTLGAATAAGGAGIAAGMYFLKQKRPRAS